MLRSGKNFRKVSLNNLNKVKRNLSKKFVEMTESNFDMSMFNEMVPKFDGKVEDVLKFVRFGDLYHRSLNEAGKAEFELFFGTKLLGRAYDLFEFGGFQTWRTFVSAAKEKFLEKKSTSILMLQLMKLKQEQNENIRSFSERVETLKNQLNEASEDIRYNNTTAEHHFRIHNEQASLRVFQDGLLGQMKLLIKARNYGTLNEAIQGALEEELYEKQNGQRNNIQCINCNKYGHLANNCWQRNRNLSNNNFNSNIVCFKCNRRGHYSSRCNWEQGVNRENRNQVKCFRCGQFGHLSSSCITNLERNFNRMNFNNERDNFNNAERAPSPSFRNRPSLGNRQGDVNTVQNNTYRSSNQKNSLSMTTGMGTVAI